MRHADRSRRAKSGANYQVARLARIEGRARGCQDMVLLNDSGRVAEATGLLHHHLLAGVEVLEELPGKVGVRVAADDHVDAGDVLLERYGNGYDAGRPHPLYSGTKSFWGLTAVAAAHDGLLELDEPVAATIAQWTQDEWKHAVTLRHLLNLTRGLRFGGLVSAVFSGSRW